MTNHTDTIILTETEKALIDAYVALQCFIGPRSEWASTIWQADPSAHQQASAACERIEQALPVPVLLTILAPYTRVRLAINGSTTTGLVRDGAWGLVHESRSELYARRMTTDAGWELWVDRTTPVDSFQIIERA